MGKKYAEAGYYEGKLARVMERFSVQEFDYNFDRHGAWIEFRYKGELYRFDHTVEKAKQHGVNISYGSVSIGNERTLFKTFEKVHSEAVKFKSKHGNKGVYTEV